MLQCIHYSCCSLHFIIPCGKFGLPNLIQVKLQQPQEQCCPVQQMHAGYFHVSVTQETDNMDYRILTMRTRDRTYRILTMRTRDLVDACVYTWGLGTPTASQHNLLTRKSSWSFSCAHNGIQILNIWISSPTNPRFDYCSDYLIITITIYSVYLMSV